MPELEGVRILVTGAGGFIGTAVVEALTARGSIPIGLVRPGRLDAARERLGPVELVEADLEHPEAIQQALVDARPNAAVNLAIPTGHPTTPSARNHSLRTSVLSTAALVEATRAGVLTRLVHVGSSLEYGQRDHPLRETDALEPVTSRGADKAAAAILVLQAARDGASTVVLRPFSVYGPYEPEGRLIPTAIRAALSGAVLPLTASTVAHDFVYVDDVADAICTALEAADHVDGQAFNVATGIQTTNQELVTLVGEATGRTVEIEAGGYPGRPVDTGTWVADVTAARERLGWKATTTLRDGLAATVAWHERRADR